MVSFQCDIMDTVDSDNSATAIHEDHSCSSCHTDSLWITAAMNPNKSSSSTAEVPGREGAAVVVPLVASGASKSIIEKMIVGGATTTADDDLLSANHSIEPPSSSSLPMVSSTPLSSLSTNRSGVMHDHLNIERDDDHHGRINKTRRVGKRQLLSSYNRSSHYRRNNYGSNNSIASAIIMSLCWIGFATANVFSSAATTTTTANSSVAVTGDNITTTNATITTSTTTTTTIGGLKLIDEEPLPLCKTFNKEQCQNHSQYCTWNNILWSCDYIHLPVTSTSPPTSLNSRAPPTISPSLQGTMTIPPASTGNNNNNGGGGGGGNKVITETPTLEPSPLPTKAPTPLPTKLPTPLPTPVPTLKPTTRAPTNVPTGRPTTKAPTLEPTDVPTVSPTFRPTSKPTLKPTNLPTPKPSPVPSMSPTGSPSVSPSASPTASPSDFPSTTPTAFPTISPKPTPLVWPSASPTISSSPTISPSHRPSSSPTISPSFPPTLFPKTSSPIAADETASPVVVDTTSSQKTAAPTPPSSLELQRRVLIEKEPTSITLENAFKMDRSSDAYKVWEESTKERIEKFAQELIEEVTGEKGVVVTVLIEDVVQRGDSKTNGRRRRVLQEQAVEGGPMKPLRLSFRTTLEFYSNQSNWDGSELIAAGFITPSQQNEYIAELQRRERESFGTVKSMVMSVNGQVITLSTDTNESIATGNTLTYVIAGVVCGVLVLFAVGGGVYYVKRRNNRRNSGFVNHKGLSGKYPDKKSPTNFYNGSGNTGTMMSSPPNNSFPPPPPPQSSGSPVGDYFGTIEPRPGEDDVSTLGDPYIGDVHVNQAMGGDNTVTESLMSSGNDMYVYGISRPRMNTGDSSRMGGGSTVHTPGGNRMTFQDDGTIEEFYGRPDSTNFHSEKDSDFEHITVVASSGVLGIVIDNPTRTTPVVHAIKESSILNGRVHVGDLLMSVDEVDCRGMTAIAVSKLIGSRSQNPTRTLRLLRGATLDDVRGDSSHIPY